MSPREHQWEDFSRKMSAHELPHVVLVNPSLLVQNGATPSELGILFVGLQFLTATKSDFIDDVVIFLSSATSEA